ncbi:MAG: N-acetylmuramoyl-L-alanine amidase [Proteobacteria bacterium]|nr:N-acetylmuramoyl-L-alanine amidase [Pseudomonadota bacterium]NBX85904.1 N-acetylmuramoyl-L-alanine amidase [Pseudomonadota bacterium]
MRTRHLLLGIFVLLMVAGAVLWPPINGNSQAQSSQAASSVNTEATGALLVQYVRVGHDVGRGVNKTRIVLELASGSKEKLTYRWFTLPQPARVVLDFGDVAFAEAPSLVTLPQGSMVKGMRAGRFRPHTVRMVLDLEQASRVNVFSIPASGTRGERLVLDVVQPRKGEKPTDIPPPQDVVDEGQAPAVRPIRVADEPAPVVPPQVVREVPSDGRKFQRDHVVVVLDPGHGGVDPGGCGRVLRVCENTLTLKMAKLVRDRLSSDKVRVILTRESDVFIPLPERVRIAQRNNADLFVSLHADIHPNDRKVRGATVYMVSEKASDREAARLADSENAGDVLAGVGLEQENPEVRNILISLVQRDTINSSAYLGQEILGEMGRVTEVRRKDLLFAGFRVLKAPDVPSVLVEMGYLSNPHEERQLNDPRFRERLASALAKGIMGYVREHVHY